MKSNYKLGDLTIQRREKYSSGNLPICGVSKDGIIPPKQKDADLSIYNVLYRNDFMFNPARMELNSIALNDKYEKAICSSLYEIFYVIDYDILLPDYLAMILASENFRRFCSFVGSGSVREYCRYANIKDYPLILPSIGQQQKIVRQYKTIADRIALKQKINDNLETIAQTFFNYEMYKQKRNNLLESKKIRALGNVITGKTPPTNSPKYYGHDVPFIKTPDMHGTPFVMESEHWLSKLGADSQPNKYIPAFSLIVACIGANAGEVAITTCQAQTNQQINSVITKYPFYLYFSFKNKRDEFRALGDGSSTMLNINKSSFEDFEVDIPTAEQICHIESNLSSLFKAICKNQSEIKILNHIQQFIISQVGH